MESKSAARPNRQTSAPFVLNPRTTHREFFGFPGAVAVIAITTTVLFVWYFSCSEAAGGCRLPATLGQWSQIATEAANYRSYVSAEALVYYALWWSWLALLYFVIPGRTAQGVPLRNGQRLDYPVNALSSFLVTVGTASLVYVNYGTAPFLWIADNYFQLAIASYIFSSAQALFVYLYSFRASNADGSPVMLALAGNSGNPVYDFFIGRELNPRVGTLDLKYFNELRPGIMSWVMLNVCFVIKQHHTYGQASNSMWLAVVPQICYCIDTLLFEYKVLTTMDITTDGFGWMLSFGDLTWVPAMYSLQARYLAFHPVHHSTTTTALIAILALGSFLVFRLSNNEKNAFRTNPSDPALSHLRFIATESGSKLLVSGWWGLARHINYTGDWVYGLAQCLATGFDTPMTYFFSAYFLVLLLHRNYRDECKCREKYKKDWDRYCESVPYMFIPYVL
ncbi:erg24, C-14 sterol reductase [Coemansia thaxteri]|nr:erg24, C-14 sterol reductase [Coemansia thaxteri]KAJ2473403.1 erg24, C-14 sterol reductase [Coemansia sp. RSA 2322]